MTNNELSTLLRFYTIVTKLTNIEEQANKLQEREIHEYRSLQKEARDIIQITKYPMIVSEQKMENTND